MLDIRAGETLYGPANFDNLPLENFESFLDERVVFELLFVDNDRGRLLLRLWRGRWLGGSNLPLGSWGGLRNSGWGRRGFDRGGETEVR